MLLTWIINKKKKKKETQSTRGFDFSWTNRPPNKSSSSLRSSEIISFEFKYGKNSCLEVKSLSYWVFCFKTNEEEEKNTIDPLQLEKHDIELTFQG